MIESNKEIVESQSIRSLNDNVQQMSNNDNGSDDQRNTFREKYCTHKYVSQNEYVKTMNERVTFSRVFHSKHIVSVSLSTVIGCFPTEN